MCSGSVQEPLLNEAAATPKTPVSITNRAVNGDAYVSPEKSLPDPEPSASCSSHSVLVSPQMAPQAESNNSSNTTPNLFTGDDKMLPEVENDYSSGARSPITLTQLSPRMHDDSKLLELSKQGVLRAALVAIVVSFACATRANLQSVESVVGAVCLVFSSLLLPTLFYLGIRKRMGNVGPGLWAAGGFIFVFGGGLMSWILLNTFSKLGGMYLFQIG